MAKPSCESGERSHSDTRSALEIPSADPTIHASECNATHLCHTSKHFLLSILPDTSANTRSLMASRRDYVMSIIPLRPLSRRSRPSSRMRGDGEGSTEILDRDLEDPPYDRPRWMSSSKDSLNRKAIGLTNIILLTLLTLCLYFAVDEATTKTMHSDVARTVSSQVQLTGNASTGLGVSLPRRTRIFQYEPIYGQSPANQSAKEAWRALFPRGKGFISRAQIQESIFHDGKALQDDKYCVAVFHQLHCLDVIRHGIYAAEEPRDMRHCIDYLRQSAMCAADSSLEAWKADVKGVDGYGQMRQCRDFGQLYAWTESFRSNDLVA